MTRGACATVALGIRRAEGDARITAPRQPLGSLDARAGTTHDLTGEAFRLLSDDVAYLKLSGVQAAQVPTCFERAKATRGLIVAMARRRP